MMTYLQKYALPIALLSLLGVSPVLAKPPINADAKAVAGSLPKARLSGGDPNKAGSEIQRTMSALAKTKRNSRSALDSVLGKAFDFRNDIGPAEEAVTRISILNAWEEAYSHGAINEQHQFTGWATRGRYSGQRLVFENIVPAEMAPEFAGYVGNVRLVPQSQVRKKGAPLSIRDQSYVRALQGVKREVESTKKMLAISNRKPLALPKRPQNATGLDMSEAEARYAQAVEAAGDAVNQPPAIRLKGQRLSTPSKLNGGRYRVLFEVSNLSRHPTEITVEFTVVGEVEEDGANPVYQMARVQETWKLRPSEVRQKEVWAAAKPRTYRGYTVVARFKGQTVAAVGSDNALQQIAETGNSIPQKPPKK